MKPIIVSLDISDYSKALTIVKELKDCVDIFKIGPVLLLSAGVKIITAINNLDKKVFLDMKLHDIPSVVEKAVQQMHILGVYSLTIHISGGLEMLRYAVRVSPRPKIWGVSVLTSLSDEDLKSIGIIHKTSKQVMHLAKIAQKCSLDGIITSCNDIKNVRKICAKELTIVTPGVTLPGIKHAPDQKRTGDILTALKDGADFVVIGRAITDSDSPKEVIKSIYHAIK